MVAEAPVKLLATQESNFIDCGSDDQVLRIAAHPKGGPERLWFDVSFECDPGPQTIGCELHYVDSTLDYVPGNVYPVFQIDDAPWQRAARAVERLHADGRVVLHWEIPRPRHHGRVALCFPYGEQMIAHWAERTSFEVSQIGVTSLGRTLRRYANYVGEIDASTPGVYITARQHSGEVPGSWVLEGIIEAMSPRQPGDPMIWVVPFVDLDGVATGRYGKAHWPFDINRAWYRAGTSHEVVACRADAERWSKRCRPRLYLDLHAPRLTDPDVFFLYSSEEPNPSALQFMELCRGTLGDRCHERFIRRGNHYFALAEELQMHPGSVADEYFEKTYGIAAVTLETSYQEIAGKPADVDAYREVGRRVAAAIRHFCSAE